MFSDILGIYLIIGIVISIKNAGALVKSRALNTQAKAELIYEVFFWPNRFIFKQN